MPRHRAAAAEAAAKSLNSMNQKILIVTLLLSLLAHVVSAQEVGYRIERLGTGLADHDVYALAEQGTRLFAVADTAGVFVFEASAGKTGEWAYIGMRGVPCREIAVDPIDPHHILVGTLPYGEQNSVIFRTTDGGATWEPSDVGIASEEIVPGRALPSKARLRFHPTDPSRVVAVGIAYPPYLSTDGGSTWTRLGGSFFGFTTINDVVWSPSRPGVMFAGGESGVLTAVLLRSTDSGETWEHVLDLPSDSLDGENAIDGIAISSSDPDLIVAGTEGFIIRSADGGVHWERAIRERLPYYMMSPAWDGESSDRVFIAGGNAHGNMTGGIFVSDDRGEHWREIARDRWSTVERGITTPLLPESFIFCAARPADFVEQDTFPHGVFIVEPTTSGIATGRDEPPTAVRVVPMSSERALHLFVSGPLPASGCVLSLYDLLGRVVETIPIGRSGEIALDGLPSGPLFYILHDGRGTIATGRTLLD